MTPPGYVAGILPCLVLWGVANACIQPTLFGGADAAPTPDLGIAAAVLTASRQLGSAVGVAVLVAVAGATGVSTFSAAWVIVLVSAVLTGIVGLQLQTGVAPVCVHYVRAPKVGSHRP